MTRIVLGAIVIVSLAACFHGAKSAVSHPEGENKVTTVPLASSNVYFLTTEQGYLMVDTDMGASAKVLEEIFSSARIEPNEVS